MTKPETEIRSLFERYNETLVKQKKEVLERLTKWGNELVRLVEDHVNRQKKLLDQHVDAQKRFLDAERKRFNAEIAAQKKKKDNEQIERLLAECKALKLDLPIIDQYEQPMSYMRVMTEAQLPPRKTDENSVHKTEENQSQNRSTEDNGNGISASEKSLRKPTSTNARSPSEQPAETQISLEHNYSTIDDDISRSEVENRDDMMDKCPVCFMIFPKSMEKQDRAQHVNEHYEDD